jgi:HEAT repeat-containing protein 5
MYIGHLLSNRIQLRWHLSSDDVFSATTAQAHCLRICAYILQHSVSSSRGPIIRELQTLSAVVSLLISRKEGDAPDRIKMIVTAFAAFTSVATAIQSNQREDVRSVAILLYSGKKRRISQFDHRPNAFPELLKDESSEIDLVGPTLPALKALLSVPIYDTPDAKNKFGRLVHGLLSACLLHVDEMR